MPAIDLGNIFNFLNFFFENEKNSWFFFFEFFKVFYIFEKSGIKTFLNGLLTNILRALINMFHMYYIYTIVCGQYGFFFPL